MKKNNIYLVILSSVSLFSFVSCGGSSRNSNMIGNSNSESNSVSSEKWNQFASAVGVPTTSQAASADSTAAITKNLTTPPSNFQPPAGVSSGDEAVGYLAVKTAVNEYVKKTSAKTQAVSVTAIQNYGSVLASEYTSPLTITYTDNPNVPNCQIASAYSVPFVQRDGCKVDLSAYKTKSGVDSDGKFKIYGTKNGQLTGEFASGTVYVVTYQLNKVTKFSYTALVTVPDLPLNPSAGFGYPLMLYAHGGDSGLNFREIATLVQKDLGKVILAAPSYPGEPICPVTSKTDNSAASGFLRSCFDDNENIISQPAVAAQGKKSPMHGDVTAYLGLQNAISNVALATPNFLTDPSAPTAGSDASKLQNYLQNYLKYYVTTTSALTGIKSKSMIPGPQTIGAGASRGAGVLLAAMGREGVMYTNMMNGTQDFEVPVLFSSALLYFPPTSMLVGQFRLVTQYLIAGNISDTSSFNAIPMVPDLRKSSFFGNYHSTKCAHDKNEMSSLIGWIASTDITYLAPYISVSTQNWAKSSPMTTVVPYLSDLSAVVPNTTSNKSLFNYFADALLDPTPLSSLPQCQINHYANDPEIKTEDCSIRGIFLKGLGGGSLNGLTVPSLPPLLKATDSTSIQGLAQFLNGLGHNGQGLQVLSLMLTTSNQVNFFTDNVQNLLPALMGSFGFASLFTGTDSYIQSLGADGGSVYAQGASQIFAHDFSGADFSGSGVSPTAIAPNAKTLQNSLPGSIVFLHGTQDTVVPFTESVIGKVASDAVFDNVYGTPTSILSPLVKNNIPAVGTQLYAFQPDNSYYNIPVGTHDAYGHLLCTSQNADGSIPANYNSTTKKCFGNFQGKMTGDGNSGHNDSAFFTSHLLNGSMQNMNINSSDSNRALFNAMRYGADSLTYKYSTGTVADQFDYFNTARIVNTTTGGSYPYFPYNNTNVNCTDAAQIRGVCYLSGFLNSDGTVSANNIPLFNRSMYQDETQAFAPMFTGAYDSNAQSSLLAPADIFSAWLESVVLTKILAN